MTRAALSQAAELRALRECHASISCRECQAMPQERKRSETRSAPRPYAPTYGVCANKSDTAARAKTGVKFSFLWRSLRDSNANATASGCLFGESLTGSVWPSESH
jgi:hypothetical protein